nr:TatD family hydrolase [Lachnospiraceae bacterium]
FESHSHYDDPAFDHDRDELLLNMEENGVGHIICAAANFDDTDRIIELTRKYPFCHLTLGVHPNYALQLTPDNRIRLEQLIKSEKPCAIGEIGLDYHYDEPDPKDQREAFIYQLKLAEHYDLPVIIHSRDAAEETLEIMKEYGPSRKGVIHCFSSSYELAKEYASMGYYIGIGGVVTFKNGRKLREIAEKLPLEHILLETDCPYLAPVPHRGERNSSLYLPLIAQEIANIKGISYEEVVSVTEANGLRLFGVK